LPIQIIAFCVKLVYLLPSLVPLLVRIVVTFKFIPWLLLTVGHTIVLCFVVADDLLSSCGEPLVLCWARLKACTVSSQFFGG